jgi:prepilin-type N-terminal cleavage/methylation domain-containing protein/prepilin-type processing-associated H-X9-DG protein
MRYSSEHERSATRVSRDANASRAFTLIEMLVVVTIIALLVALLLPAIKKAKLQARTIQCMSQIRPVMMAATMYSADSMQWLPHGHWGTPTILGGASQIIDLLGNREATLKLLTCPEHEPIENGDHAKYYVDSLSNGPANTFHSTYMWVGGHGGNYIGGVLAHDGNIWWYGWVTYGSDTFDQYEDPYQFGPATTMESRLRAGDVGVMTDRMWPANIDSYHYPYNWADRIGVIQQNHRGGLGGESRGGNVAYLDGHVEWRHATNVRERVLAYHEYNPYIVY